MINQKWGKFHTTHIMYTGRTRTRHMGSQIES
jgi:hypothetical protein